MGSLTKALIGKEDCSVQEDDSYPEQFSRLNSVGSAINLTSFPNIWKSATDMVNAKYYGAHDATGATLNGAVGQSASNSCKDIYIEGGAWVISTDYDWSSYTTVRWIFGSGAYLSIAAGCTVTFPSPSSIVASPNQQIFSGSGTVSFSVDGDKWVDWWGAKPDNSTDCGTAFNAAITCGGPILLNAGTYQITTGDIDLDSTHGYQGGLFGRGKYETVIYFADTSITTCFNGVVAGATCIDEFTFKDLTIKGPGKAAGTTIDGVSIYNSAADSDSPFAINFEDVYLEDLSGNAIYIPRLWNSTLRRVRTHDIALNGIVVGANPSVLIEQSDYLVADGAAIWVIDGKPTLISNNIGDCAQGMKFGRTASDFAAPYNTARNAYPTIIGANIEGIAANGEGLYFNSGSYPHFMSQIDLWTAAGVTVDYGVYIDFYGSAASQSFSNNIAFNVVSGGSYTEKIYVRITDTTSGGLIYYGDASNISANGHTPLCVVPFQIRKSSTYSTFQIGASLHPATDNTYYLGKNDDDDALAWKGVILKDTANGKYYRIEVTNGSVVATDLTD